MLKIKKNTAQASSSEYIFIFFIVASAIIGMSVYLQRVLQARVYDARNTMIDIVDNSYSGYLYKYYEPYYDNTQTSVTRDIYNEQKLLSGKSSGIFRKTIDEKTYIQRESTQAPPGNADREYGNFFQ